MNGMTGGRTGATLEVTDDRGQALPLMAGLLVLAVVALAVVASSVQDGADGAKLATAADAAALAGAAQSPDAADRLAALNGGKVRSYQTLTAEAPGQTVIVAVGPDTGSSDRGMQDRVGSDGGDYGGDQARAAASELPTATTGPTLDEATIAALKQASERFGELVVVEIMADVGREGVGLEGVGLDGANARAVGVPQWTAELLAADGWACGLPTNDGRLRRCQPPN